VKEYSVDQKRNVAFAGHHGAGKTSLVETLLFNQGVIDRVGKTEDGTAFCDFTDEEKARKQSIYSTLIHLNLKNHRINVLDLPGAPGFLGEIKSGLRVVDGAVIVLDATSGVGVETEHAWEICEEFEIPRIAVVNKLDKERADFQKTLTQMQSIFSASNIVPFHLPIGAESDFQGVVDLIKMKALKYDDKGTIASEESIPEEMQGQADEYREQIMDYAAETDEEVMAKYLEGEDLTEEEIINGLKKGVATGSFVPVFCTSAEKRIGMASLINAMVGYLPAPDFRTEMKVKKPDGSETTIKTAEDAPLCAYVFKTLVDPFAGRLSFFRVFSGSLSLEKGFYNSSIESSEKAGSLLDVNGKKHNSVNRVNIGDIAAIPKSETLKAGHTLCDDSNKIIFPEVEFPPPVMQMAIHAKNKGDDEKLGTALPKIVDEDQTLKTERNPETHELVIYGMGDIHLNVVTSRLKSQFGIEIEMTTPKVAYRETITKKNEGRYRHKKQSGGRGQFGEVYLRLEPLPRGEGFEFVDNIVGGVISGKFIPSVEKGVHERMERGVIAGYPVTDVKVTLFDGSMHAVDSSDMAFKIAGSMGFKQIAVDCKPILLEPIFKVVITVPEEYMGDVISDLNTKRAKIMGMDPQDGKQLIKAQAPLSEMFTYCIDLRSISRARGSFVMEFSHYEPVPGELAEKIVAERQKELSGEEE
jgi:elongation factor G